jgi:hypothetical protein
MSFSSTNNPSQAAQISIAENANNDIYIDSSGNLVFVTNVDAVEQDCKGAMQAQFGEMFLNPTGGLPTLADVWSTRNFIKWEAFARQTLSAVPGVVKVVSFVITTNGDVLNYSAGILTQYSTTLSNIAGTLDT